MSATVAERPRVRRVPRPRPLRAHAVPRALVLGERAGGRGRAPPPRAARRVGRARATSAPAPTSCARCSTTASRRIRRSPRCACAGSWAASSWRRRTTGLRWGRRVCAARGRPRRAAAPAGRRGRAHAAAHGHVGRAAPHRARADRGARRGRRMTTGADGERPERLERLGRRRGGWHRRRRSVAGTRDAFDPSDPHALVSFASNDYLGLTQHPAVRRRRARGHRPLGHRCRRGAPHRRLPTGARRARDRAGGLEGHRAPRSSSAPGSPPTSGCSPPSPAPTPSCAPTSSTTPRSSTGDGCRARRSPSTTTVTPPTSTSCCAPAPPRAPSS